MYASVRPSIRNPSTRLSQSPFRRSSFIHHFGGGVILGSDDEADRWGLVTLVVLSGDQM